MKSRFLCMIAFLLIGGTMSAQQYTPNAHSYDNNMPIVATVLLDGVAQTSGELGAFIGNEVRGTATVQALLDNTYWIQVYYNSDTESSETITFKYFDGTDEYDITTTVAVNPEGIGTKAAPQELEIVTAVTQTTALDEGWTWWSTPIEQNGNDGLQQLQNSISQYGVKIMSENGTRIKRPNGMWTGGFSSLLNEECYKINVSDASSVTMIGTLADPSDHPITVVEGWNWIGYPVSIEQSANVALANHQPQNLDVIMGPDGSATYRNGLWRPNMTLKPGSGYMYNSKASEEKTFVYDVNRSLQPSEIEEEPYWIANTHKYENCMVIVATVYIGDEEQRDESLELGAFVKGECTGTAKLFYVEEDDRYVAVLTVGGEEGDKVTFGLVNEAKGVLYNDSRNSLSFGVNAIVGDLDNPYKIHFDGTGLGETSLQVAVFPNPVDKSQSFKLNLPREEEVLDVTISNALGAIIRHEAGAVKSVIAGLPVSGVYTVKVVCRSGKTYYGRVIVK